MLRVQSCKWDREEAVICNRIDLSNTLKQIAIQAQAPPPPAPPHPHSYAIPRQAGLAPQCTHTHTPHTPTSAVKQSPGGASERSPRSHPMPAASALGLHLRSACPRAGRGDQMVLAATYGTASGKTSARPGSAAAQAAMAPAQPARPYAAAASRAPAARWPASCSGCNCKPFANRGSFSACQMQLSGLSAGITCRQRGSFRCAVSAGHLAIGETVSLMTPPFLSLLKHLIKVEGGAAE